MSYDRLHQSLRHGLTSLLVSTCLWLFSPSAMAVTVVFSDDFERLLLGLDWIVTPIGSKGKAAIGTHISNSGTRSMYTCCDEVTVTSRAMDLSGVNFAEVDIWIRSGADSYSEWASSGDDLYVQGYMNDGSWVTLKIFEGGGSTAGDEYNYVAKLPDEAYHAGFRLRFYQIDGSGTTLTDRDFWHIDDVQVIDYEVGTVQYPQMYDDFERSDLFSTGDWSTTIIDGNYDSQTSTHFSTSGSRSMYSCCGVRYTTSRDIDLSAYTFAELSFEVMQGDDSVAGSDALDGSWDSETPSLGDDFAVEYYKSDGTWQQLDYYLGSTLTDGQRHSYHARVPDDGYHSAFKVRFYQIDGSISGFKHYDLWHVDEFYVGTRTPAPPAGPDHFQLSYTSSALTCNAHSVTVTACADASCSTTYTDPVTVDLNPTGWVGGDSVSFSGGSTTAQISHTSVGTITLGVSSSTPATTGGATQCRIDGGAASSTCDLTFSDSGFFFDVPDIVAAKGTTGVVVRSLKSDQTQQCVPGFQNVSKTIKLWQGYDSPATGSRLIQVNSVDVGGSESSLTTQVFAFNNDGEASFDVNYTDAGNMQLNMRYDGSGTDAGLVMTGSDQFVSRPAGMCVSATTLCMDTPLSDCPAFAAAGATFPLQVTPKAWVLDSDPDYCDNPVDTPNYADSALALSVNKVSPVGGVTGSVSPTSYNHAVSGLNSVNVAQSEVGVFTFSVTPPAYQGGYFNGSLTPVTYTSYEIGRFYPSSFSVSVSDGTLDSACSGTPGFTYTGQDSFWLTEPTITITALNAGGAITQNYTESGYQMLTAGNVSSALTAPVQDSTATGKDALPLPVTVTSNTGSLSTASAGVMTYTFDSVDTVRYDRSTNSEVAPFTPDLDWALGAFSDSDGAAYAGSETITPAAVHEIRFGRLWVEDTYGPENENLNVPLRAEYFNGSRYVVNADDNCTTWNSSNAAVTPSTLTSVGASSGVLSSGLTANAGILLLAPTGVAGTPDTGEADVTYSPDSWLQGDYDADGSFEDPQGVATFGVFRGHQRKIYQREVR